MTDALYSLCADVLHDFQSVRDTEALLHPENGFASKLCKVCDDLIKECFPNSEAAQLLRLERNTWALLQIIMAQRKTQRPKFVSAREMLSENPYSPTSDLAQAIMKASPILCELIVIREWLQDTAPRPRMIEATSGYWSCTKHSMMQARRTDLPNNESLVEDLDPDATTRGKRRALASEDANYEKVLLQALYHHMRAGQLDEAFELCRRAQQPWRAASIRGSLWFRWRAMCAHDDSDSDSDDGVDGYIGNRRRQLWRSMATRAALNPALSEPERVLYASLAPSPETFSVLKSACRTWEDLLWAKIIMLCEQKQGAALSALGGGFWEEGMPWLDRKHSLIQGLTIDEDREEATWGAEVIQSLQELQAVPVAEGPPADDIFHDTQLHLILDQVSELLERFAAMLNQGSWKVSPTQYPVYCRFFAHLCLFLQLIDMSPPPMAVQRILETYLEVLEDAGQHELIAQYACALGDNAVERYAHFLVSLGLAEEKIERQRTLSLAREHGLDVERVAIAAAERTIETALGKLPSPGGPLPSLSTPPVAPSVAEMLLFRALEWTTFSSETYFSALLQANTILRYFLATGKVDLARDLRETLEDELNSIAESKEDAKEYMHYTKFFDIWDLFDRIAECEASKVAQMSVDASQLWLQQYKTLIDAACDKVLELLTFEWLVTDVEVPGGGFMSMNDFPSKLGNLGDQRRQELIRIRQIFIPELIIRLHNVLFASRIYMRTNLTRALKLSTIVADARYKLYEDFPVESGRGLGDYLDAVRQCTLAGLQDYGGSDPFRVLTL
ncbi:hypothetical protein FISHEDRAFT_40657 [Fistulina hepatica ATCC 64428]|uniref:Nuclear pore complex protein n=1 Tax=Fistulina hepatica ATCC 64428 TaxID=1128425 RepID=A0A0D7AE79_9AGAR|nr:hypothetical protein FISHEDRAFT_40657 [Fistulina hepatica ATCC 64428]